MHHTGIKTRGADGTPQTGAYFNCTIQELKPAEMQKQQAVIDDFNCTIQELKLMDGISIDKYVNKISIAPYRN